MRGIDEKPGTKKIKYKDETKETEQRKEPIKLIPY